MGSLDIPALIIATTLSIHGLHKGSLRLDGALAAFLVGYGHLANPLRVFGAGLIFFYLAGSRATKVKIHVKAKLEDGPNPLRPGGNRSALQVLTNSLPSLLAALYFRFRVSFAMKYAYCPFDYDLPKKLVYIALAQLATNFGDTLASELGILSTHQPRYIFTLKRVPKGTNGAISLWGTIMSIVGGGSIALVMVVCLAIERSCQGLGWAWEMVVFGCYMGFCGSLLDTILGALFQETLYSPKDQKILTDLSHRPGERVIRIGIGRNVLGNSTVNFLSGTIMAIVGYYYA